MAYNEHLAERIKRTLHQRHVSFEEKKMMGGVCYMVNHKMCVGVIKENVMARINPEIYETALTKAGCKKMDFTGRPMKGFVFVEPSATDLDEDLEYWVNLCLDYNPKAKSTKKK